MNVTKIERGSEREITLLVNIFELETSIFQDIPSWERLIDTWRYIDFNL